MEKNVMNNESEAIISLENVTKIYSSSFEKMKSKFKPGIQVKGIKAVDNISLSVNKGEIFGLLGANGSGKTTIIKIVCGLIHQNQGKVFVLGKDINLETSTIMKEVGAVVEAPTMFKDMTGLENLRYFAKLQGGIDDRRINDIITLVGLEDRKNSKFSTYSLGMKQRLGIAQAIMHNPKLLVLDEPINGLDPDGIIQMRDLLIDIRNTYGTTILISSHILSEMQNLCDRVAIMVKGKVVAVKTIEEVQAQADGLTIACIICSDNEKALAIINESMPDVEVKIHDGKLYVRFKGDKLSEINKLLVLQDIAISSVNVKKRTLEDLYKELTKHE